MTEKRNFVGVVDYAIAFVFFIFSWASLLFAAQGKPFWVDETDGWQRMQFLTWTQLIKEGAPPGQVSRSPLSYLFDRILIFATEGHPQAWWELLFFFRIPTTFYWAATCSFLYLFLKNRISQKLGNLAGFIAFTAMLFVFTNSFATYYAIEARSYSLWLAVTTVQFCYFWDLMQNEARNKSIILFFIFSVAMVLTTYASSLILAVASLSIFTNQTFTHKNKLLNKINLGTFFTMLTCAAITVYYFSKSEKMNYTAAPLSLYASSVLEVILKSFHHHGSQPAFFTFPVLFFLIPAIWVRKNKTVFYTAIQAILMIIVTYLQYYASTKSGGIYASRYAIFLIPYLSFLYLLGVFSLLTWLITMVKNSWRIEVNYKIYALILSLICLGWLLPFIKGMPGNIARFRSLNSYSYNSDKACISPLPYSPEEVHALNKLCRKLP